MEFQDADDAFEMAMRGRANAASDAADDAVERATRPRNDDDEDHWSRDRRDEGRDWDLRDRRDEGRDWDAKGRRDEEKDWDARERRDEGREWQDSGSHRTAESLPRGWEAVQSRSTGKTYYVNTYTEESQYDIPTAPARGGRETRSERDEYDSNSWKRSARGPRHNNREEEQWGVPPSYDPKAFLEFNAHGCNIQSARELHLQSMQQRGEKPPSSKSKKKNRSRSRKRKRKKSSSSSSSSSSSDKSKKQKKESEKTTAAPSSSKEDEERINRIRKAREERRKKEQEGK
mmetsp:Transcript_109030/g.172243  ORF Transcript_109030/g.172243 Transcript_109030/m.172243 type:complete len:288 (-) Transcript_109030:53-916(-)